MKIACLSGKGGAGKTFVAVNLAAAAGEATYIDCDVEEPNGRLFLKPKQTEEVTVATLLPQFDQEQCNGCRKCVDFCRFHALMYIKEKPVVFSEVCHSCGGCLLVCPEHAVAEQPKPIGKLEVGFAHLQGKEVKVVTGNLNPGEASGVPVIKKALTYAEQLTVIDCPPGSACSVMESVEEADFCVLVAEPTAFGFHNFKMVYELVTLLEKKCAVVINKEEKRYEPLETFCIEHQIPVLARIPYDSQIANMVAEGKIVSLEHPQMRQLFNELLQSIGGAI